MILYHGSNVDIFKVDLTRCNFLKDFGMGFYTTPVEKYAHNFARRKVRLDRCGVPTIVRFEAPNDLLYKEDLNCRIFDENSSLEWFRFICNNRYDKYTDFSNIDCNKDNKYDIVAGPTTNDDVSKLIRIYFMYIDRAKDFEELRNIEKMDILLQGISLKEMSDQYTFHTEKALKYLKRVDSYVLRA